MRYEIPFRVVIREPLADVVMRVQRGKDEFLEPAKVTAGSISFEFEITAEVSGTTPNFLGKYAQGPKGARFVYVNSGGQARQNDALWSRRAKLSLMQITQEQIEAVTAQPGHCIETIIDGVGRDGGPICASVKEIRWEVVRR